MVGIADHPDMTSAVYCGRKFKALNQTNKQKLVTINLKHGGKSKGTTCVVDRDVTAYMVVDRVLRFPTE